MAGPNIIGLDLSLSATGVCTQADAHVFSSRKRGMERLDEILHHIDDLINDDDIVVLEGYAMGTGRQSGTYAIGELGGVVRHALWGGNVTYVEIPPATLKKFATGKGNAGKPDMLAAAIRHGYEGPNDDNCVDAWWLRHMGLYALGAGYVTDTEYRNAACAAIEWPNV